MKLTDTYIVFSKTWRPWVAAPLVLLVVLSAGLLLPMRGLLLCVGLLSCAQIGLLLFGTTQPNQKDRASLLDQPFRLARHPELFERYQSILKSLVAISQQTDPIYRDIALEQLDEMTQAASVIAVGMFVFDGTETWRIVYERLLRSPGLFRYRSVAWIKNANYWQDEPGRKSLAVNFELHSSGQLTIARIAIIADELWPEGDVWPTELLRQWIHEQHARGLSIKVVRESVLKNEPDLLADIGIYGNRALGIQELDDQCRTVRFTLTFDYAQVQAAEERWRRLEIYAESWSGYLDRYEIAD